MLQTIVSWNARRPFSPLLLFVLRFSSMPISSPSPPTHEDVAHLILDQKSATRAFQTFRSISRIPNFLHNQATYKAIIHKLCLFKQFDTALRLLSEIPDVLNSPPGEDIFARIIKDYGQAKMSQDAIRVLDLVAQFKVLPSLKIYNSILNVLVKDDIDLARDFFRNCMVKRGVLPDDYTYGILMKGFCVTNRIRDGFKLLKFMSKHGFEPNTVIYNTLIHALCKNGKVGRGRSLMREMVEPSDVTFNILISGYCRDGDPVQAMVLFEKSLSIGYVPDVVTVTKLVECLCDHGRVREGVEVLQRVEEKGRVIDAVAYNTLIDGFCKGGEVEVGESYLKEMALKGCLPNLSTYNILVAGYCKAGKLQMAVDLFHEMRTDGVIPNWHTYDTLISGLCEGGRIQDGFKVLNLMEESKVTDKNQINVYNTLIYGLYRENGVEYAHNFLSRVKVYFPRVVHQTLRILGLCKEGKIGEAKLIFDQMVDEGDVPSVIVYDCLVDGLCRERNVQKALGLVNLMVTNGLFPNIMTFNSLIGGFCKEGEVENAVRLMDEVVEKGCSLDIESYTHVIQAFLRSGKLGRASEILFQMVEKHILPDHSLWNSLLLYLQEYNSSVNTIHKHYETQLLDQIRDSAN